VILALLAVVPLMLDRVRLLEQERIDDGATEVLELARRGADGQREILITTKAMTPANNSATFRQNLVAIDRRR
jgi:hypothetical protein